MVQRRRKEMEASKERIKIPKEITGTAAIIKTTTRRTTTKGTVLNPGMVPGAAMATRVEKATRMAIEMVTRMVIEMVTRMVIETVTRMAIEMVTRMAIKTVTKRAIKTVKEMVTKGEMATRVVMVIKMKKCLTGQWRVPIRRRITSEAVVVIPPRDTTMRVNRGAIREVGKIGVGARDGAAVTGQPEVRPVGDQGEFLML